MTPTLKATSWNPKYGALQSARKKRVHNHFKDSTVLTKKKEKYTRAQERKRKSRAMTRARDSKVVVTAEDNEYDVTPSKLIKNQSICQCDQCRFQRQRDLDVVSSSLSDSEVEQHSSPPGPFAPLSPIEFREFPSPPVTPVSFYDFDDLCTCPRCTGGFWPSRSSSPRRWSPLSSPPSTPPQSPLPEVVDDRTFFGVEEDDSWYPAGY